MFHLYKRLALVVAAVLLFSSVLSVFTVQAQGPASVGLIAWSRDGKKLAVSNWRGITVYDSALKPLSPNLSEIGSIADFDWSPDGKYIVTVQFDMVAQVWDTETGKLVRTLAGHTDRVTGAVWSPDNSKIATASRDYSIRLWDAAKGTVVDTQTFEDMEPFGIAWSPSSQEIAFYLNIETRPLSIWNLATKTVKAIKEDFFAGRLTWREPNKIMISQTILDLRSGGVFNPPDMFACPFAESWPLAHWSYDGSRLIYTSNYLPGRGSGFLPDREKQICVVDVGDKTRLDPSNMKQIVLIKIVDTSFRHFGAVALSPDGKTVVAVADYGNKWFAWDTSTGKQIASVTLGEAQPVAKLELVAVCSPSRGRAQRWQVINKNPFAVEFLWRLEGEDVSPKSRGYGVVGAAQGDKAGETFITVIGASGKSSLTIYSPGYQQQPPQDTKEGIDTKCPAATVTASPTR